MRSYIRFFQLAAVFAGVFSIASATVGCGGDGSDGGACCKVCSTGKACGDTCIESTDTCHVGNGCACNASLAINAPPAATKVEPFIYIGPAGLRYESGDLSGPLPEIPASIELQAGQTASVYWEHIYLGELVPASSGVLSFNDNFHSRECTNLATRFVMELISVNGKIDRTASLASLESMGFPNIDILKDVDDIEAIASEPDLLAGFGAGLEFDRECH